MRFDDFDNMMRKYEESLDQTIVPDVHIVARLDGRGFTRLTKEDMKFEAPFDVHFREYMVETVRHLMNCGFNIVYGYTQSDEISLLFHRDDNTFGRNTRKINSILAGEASAWMSLALNNLAVFDCRVVPLPNLDRVIDYFLWRQEDAHRNSLNAHCYWILRNEGMSRQEAAFALCGKSTSCKNELLFKRGINFNNLPLWQKRGVGVYYKDIYVDGFNPVTNSYARTKRRRLFVDYELPVKEEYGFFLEKLIEVK